MDTLAKRLKAARGRLGLLQSELAQKSGMKQSDISKIENGLILKTTGVVALARALRCDPEWLATGEGSMVSAAVWPFVLLTPDQASQLNKSNREAVEGYAIKLLGTQRYEETQLSSSGQNESRILGPGGAPLPHIRKTLTPAKKGKRGTGSKHEGASSPRKRGNG